MLSVCPRCRRANPVGSAYCWFDGGSLLSARDGVQGLPQEFLFPTGRRCATLEEFAQACQDDWSAARELLAKDTIRQYFATIGRHDLVRLAQDAMQQPNRDVALARFVDGLPVARSKAAKLDLHPRRFTLGRLPAGDRCEIELVLANLGSGALQGTVAITEGNDWLSFPDAPGKAELPVRTAKEQGVRLAIDASKLKSAQQYVGRLVVVTNGGVAETPVRFEIVGKPFAKAPFQGVKTPRELAEKMRQQAKQAGAMLEGGDVERWFAANNWDYPVDGPVAKGMAGVQQFFEAMGLSRPPLLQLSQKDLRFSTHYPETVRFQVSMQTTSRKWVYGHVESDRPWLRVLTPNVIGPQHASILLEADPTLMGNQPAGDGLIRIKGNGGQKLEASVRLEVKNVPPPNEPGRWRPIVDAAMLFVVARLALVPLVDLHASPAALAEAGRSLELTLTPALAATGGWLRLPWVALLAGFDAPMPLDLFEPGSGRDSSEASLQAREFRHYFVGALVRDVIVWTWWLGPIAFVAIAIRRGTGERSLLGVGRELAPAIAAGGVAGAIAAAAAACLVLAMEILPHVVWSLAFGRASGPAWLIAWIAVAAVSWGILGALAGFAVSLAPARVRSIASWPPTIFGRSPRD